MSKIISLLAVICIVSVTVCAQSTKRRFFCGYGEGHRGAELCAKIQASSFASDADAEQAIERLLLPVGLKTNFVLLACSQIDNAAAITYDDGARYIIYDRAFMTRIAQGSNTNFAALSILAHEIGHHLQGHTTALMNYPPSKQELNQKRMQELEADEFSGFIMYKLGASLAEAQSGINGLKDVGNEESSTHPKNWRRLAAIETGYRKAEGQRSVGHLDQRPSAEAFLAKGHKAIEKKDYRTALDNYNTALVHNPGFADAYFGRGYARWYGYQDYKGGLEDYTEAIRLKPNYSFAYNNRGAAKYETKDYKGAMEDYNEAIRFKPDYAAPYHNRGLIKFNIRKDYKGALEDYAAAIRINPNYADAYFNRGILKSEINQDYAGAIEDYDAAIRANPTFARAYMNRGNLKYNMYKDNKGALEDLTAAIRADPNYAEAFYNRGVVRSVGNNDYTGAIEDYDAAIRIDDKYANAYFGRGYVKYQLGDKSGACQDFRKSCSLGSAKGCKQVNSCN